MIVGMFPKVWNGGEWKDGISRISGDGGKSWATGWNVSILSYANSYSIYTYVYHKFTVELFEMGRELKWS